MGVIIVCVKIINNVADIFEICGKKIYESISIEMYGIMYRIDLCEKHYNELIDLENKKE